MNARPSRIPATVLRPLLATDTWVTVMHTAGWQCQCRGACGNHHTKTAGRCPAGTEPPARRLYATDPTSTDRHTADDEQLTAWCGPCLDGTRRAIARTTTSDPDQGALFPASRVRRSPRRPTR